MGAGSVRSHRNQRSLIRLFLVAAVYSLLIPVSLLAAMPPVDAADSAPRRESLQLDAAVLAARGLEFQRRPRPEDQQHAEVLFRKALRRDPDLAPAHAGLARVSTYLYTLGLEETPERLEQALTSARRAVELAPGDGPIRATLALALAAGNRLTPALEEARLGVEFAPHSAATHAAHSIVLRLRGRLDEAVVAGRRAAALEPNSPQVLIALADALRESKQYDSALALYGQAVDLDPEAIVPQLGAAATHQLAVRTSLAERAFIHLRDEWDYAGTRILQGMAANRIKLRDYEGALALYEEIELPPNGSLPTLLSLYGKGYCLLRLGRPAEAEFFLSTMVDRIPPEYDGPARGREFLFRAFQDLAGYFEARDRTEKAKTILRQACARRLAPTRLASRLATILVAEDRADAAADILQAVIVAGDPDEDPLELAAGVLQLLRLRSADGQRRPSRRGETAKALEAAAARIASSRIGAAHYRLARAQALARNRDAALASLARALDHGYLPRDRMAGEHDFEPIRDEPAFQNLLNP